MILKHIIIVSYTFNRLTLEFISSRAHPERGIDSVFLSNNEDAFKTLPWSKIAPKTGAAKF